MRVFERHGILPGGGLLLLDLTGYGCHLLLGLNNIAFDPLDVDFPVRHHISQGTEHDAVDHEQKYQKSNNLNDQGFINADKRNVADYFHGKHSMLG